MGLAPFAQRIAASRRFELDHVGPEISQLQRQHIARHQSGQIYDPDTLQRTAGRVVGRDDG